MKKHIFFLIIATIISCTPEAAVDYAIISGKITNSKSDKITVYSSFNSDHKIEVSINEDGSFKDTLRMDSDFYFLRQDRNSVEFYLPKGEELIVNYNAAQKNTTLQMAGSVSSVNEYIIEKAKLSKELTGDRKELFLKNETDFKAHLLKIKTAQEDLLSKTDGIQEEFATNEIKNINYQYLSTLSRYQSYHGYYLKDRNFKVSKSFLTELKDVDIENENDFLFSQEYRNVVSSILRNQSQELIKKDSIAGDIAYLKAIANVKNDLIRNKLLFDDAKYGITYTENLEDYYDIFSKYSNDATNNSKIEKDYKKIKALAQGNPSPEFKDYENYAGGKTSSKDLNGKYTYIDVWATWCGPCIAEIPSLKKVEEQFHGKNIEFVSISIDREKDHEKWKKMIVDRGLGGMQLFADNNWQSQFIQDYMIKGIPRFILIDPQGNIVNANAPRPSNKKLVETLKSLNL